MTEDRAALVGIVIAVVTGVSLVVVGWRLETAAGTAVTAGIAAGLAAYYLGR